MLLLLLTANHLLAQTPSGTASAITTNDPPPAVAEPTEPTWSFSASAYTYLVPDSREYVQPTFTADRGWLHLEARYNYEDLETEREIQRGLLAGFSFWKVDLTACVFDPDDAMPTWVAAVALRF